MMNQKKGDTVILCGFTGIKLGVFEVTAATKKTLTLTKANGDELIFDRKTGKQVNIEEGKERYANKIIDDDGSYVAPVRTGGKKKSTKKPTKKQPEPVEDDEDEEDDDDEDDDEDAAEVTPPKKSTKKNTPAKKSAPAKKPSKKAPIVEEDDDEDEFEEIDD